MKVQIYELTKCGYYQSLAEDEDCEFGSLREWWNDFDTWASRGDYKLTGTFKDNREPHTVYCTRSTQDTQGNAGIALWNVAPSWEGRALHLPPAGQVNSVQMNVSRVETGSLAGWPTYFWILKRQDIVVALVPDGMRGSGIPHFRKYFREYLNTRDRRSERARDEGLAARIETRALRRPGERREIADMYEDVRKYVTNTTYEPPEPTGPGWMERGIRAMISERLETSRPASRGANNPRTTRSEIDWRPESRHDLLEVIGAWDDAGYDDNNWAGVKTSDGRLHRFDDNLCREPVEVSEEIGADPRWSRETLERAWEHSRDQVEVLVSKLRRLNE